MLSSGTLWLHYNYLVVFSRMPELSSWAGLSLHISKSTSAAHTALTKESTLLANQFRIKRWIRSRNKASKARMSLEATETFSEVT